MSFSPGLAQHEVKKQFGKDFGTFRAYIRRFPAEFGRKPKFEFSKIWKFWPFYSKFGDFVFQNKILIQNRLKIIKNGFTEFL